MAWNEEVRLSSGVLLGGILVLAAVLRFTWLGQNSLWFDEAWEIYLAHRGWAQLLFILRVADAHPPLYYLFIKAMAGLVGTSEAVLRFPSACFSLVTVYLTYVLARRMSTESVALLASFLLSIAPLDILVAQQIRMYALLGMLAVGSTVAMVAAADRSSVGRWCLYAVMAVLMAYTQYLGVLVLIAHGVWIMLWARSRLWWWCGAIAAAAVLYLPWLPSFWFQVVHAHGWAWYRDAVHYPIVGDLLSLYAFGGTLFGTANYFIGGTAGPLDEAILLLPFLVALWRGIASFGSDRRSLGMIGLPLLVPIGVMFAISITKPMFYPRWFSFLLPFYMVFIARGIVDVADRIRGARRDYLLACITAGLLLYNMPAITQYYFDSVGRVYDWRAAATLVEKGAKPGDYLLFVNSAAEIAFRYYYHEKNAFMTLSPIESVNPNARPTFTADRARALARQHPRIWMIATPPFQKTQQDRLLPVLSKAFHPKGMGDFGEIWVYLLVPKTVHAQ